MTVNRYKPHLLIVPEDDANKDLALGFFRGAWDIKARSFYVEDVAGGWGSARDRLGSLCEKMKQDRFRHVLVLVDFDQSATRREEVLRDVPEECRDRVYVLGVWSEPEALQAALGHASREKIGEALARECEDGTDAHWSHELLSHNAAEVARLRPLIDELREAHR